jgi:hypothetical protein
MRNSAEQRGLRGYVLRIPTRTEALGKGTALSGLLLSEHEGNVQDVRQRLFQEKAVRGLIGCMVFRKNLKA